MSSDFRILDSQFRLIETKFDPKLIVMKALEVATERQVAIRTPNDQLAVDSAGLQAFIEEGHQLARLDDPHVVTARFFPAGSFDDRGYLVTEWWERTLANLLVDRYTDDLRFAVEILTSVLDGLHALHGLGRVHGQLSPGDVVVLDDGEHIKLATTGLFPITNAVQSPGFRAPERTASKARADIRSDIYSVGAIGYRLLMGESKFERALSTPLVPPLRELVPQVPESLSQVVGRMVSARPSDRYPSPAAARNALVDAQRVSGVVSTGTPATPRPKPAPGSAAVREPVAPRKRRKRHGGAWPAIVAIAVTAAAVAGWYFKGPANEQEPAARATVALDAARVAALEAGAEHHAGLDLEQAERGRREAELAYRAARYDSAVRLATAALEDYRRAEANAMKARAELARDGALAARDAAVTAGEDGAPEFSAALAELALAEEAFAEQRFLAAESGFEEQRARFDEMALRARALTARTQLEAALAGAGEVGLGVDNPLHAAALAARDAGASQLEAGELRAALETFETAHSPLDALVREVRIDRVKAAEQAAALARRAAVDAGVEDGVPWAAGVSHYATGESALEREEYETAEHTFEVARRSFENALLRHEALVVQLQTEEEREAAAAAGAGEDSVPFKDARAYADFAEGALTAGEYRVAMTSFRTAIERYRAAAEQSLRTSVDSLIAEIQRLESLAEANRGRESAHYHLGKDQYALATEQLERGDVGDAVRGFRSARRDFELALEETHALAELRAAKSAEQQALDAGADPASPEFRQALRQRIEGEQFLEREEYSSARSGLKAAAAAFRETERLALGTRSDRARSSALESKRALEVAGIDSARLEAADRQMAAAEAARQQGQLLVAEARFLEARAQYRRILEQAEALDVRALLPAAREAALAAGASMADQSFRRAVETLELGEQRLRNEEFRDAREAFVESMERFQQAEDMAVRKDVERVRQAALAAREAAQSETATTATGDQLIVEGDQAAGEGRFDRAREAYDEARIWFGAPP